MPARCKRAERDRASHLATLRPMLASLSQTCAIARETYCKFEVFIYDEQTDPAAQVVDADIRERSTGERVLPRYTRLAAKILIVRSRSLDFRDAKVRPDVAV